MRLSVLTPTSCTSSRFPQRCPSITPPTAIGSVTSLFTGSRDCVLVRHYLQSSPSAQGQHIISQGVARVTGAVNSDSTMNQFICAPVSPRLLLLVRVRSIFLFELSPDPPLFSHTSLHVTYVWFSYKRCGKGLS